MYADPDVRSYEGSSVERRPGSWGAQDSNPGVSVTFVGLCVWGHQQTTTTTENCLQSPDLSPNSSQPSLWAVEHELKPLTLTDSRKPRVKGFKEKTDSGLSSAHKILGKLSSGHVMPPPGQDAHQQTLGQCWHVGAGLLSAITGRESLFFERFRFMWQKSKLR